MGTRLVRKAFVALIAIAVAGIGVMTPEVGAVPPPDTTVQVTADFESLTANQMVNSISTGSGMVTDSGRPISGAVGITGVTTRPPRDANWAAIFDATCSQGGRYPCGGDPDLRQPQQGNVLITDRKGDGNGDGFVDSKYGANDAYGHVLTFDFRGFGLGTVTPRSITVLDIDKSEAAARIEFIAGDALLDTLMVPVTGNGGIVTLDLTGIGAGADRIRVHFPKSGAMDDLVFDARVPCEAPADRAAAATANALHVEIPGLSTTIDLPDPLATSVGTDATASDSNELLDETIADLIDIELLRQEVEADGFEFANGTGFTLVEGLDIADGLITIDAVSSRSHAVASPFGAFGSTIGSQVDGIAVGGVPLLDLAVGEVVTLGSVIPILDIGEVSLYDRSVGGELVDGRWVGSASMTALRVEIFPTAFPAGDALDVLNGLVVEVGTTTATASAAANPCSNQVAPFTDASAEIVAIEAGLVPIPTIPGIGPDLAAVNLLTAGPIAPAGYDFAQGLGLTVDGVAGAGIGVVEAEGVTDNVTALANARAELLGLDLLDGTITADLLRSHVRVSADESDTVVEAGAEFLNVTVPFVAAPISVCDLPVATVNPDDGSCTVPPNTELAISVLGTNLVTVVLNQQVDTATGLQTGPGIGCADAGVTDCTVRAIALKTGLDQAGLATQVHLVESQATAAMPAAP